MSLREIKSDEFYCESIAKSISEIIRFSLDEEFRKSSFKLFGVSSTKETENEIRKRLMSIIKNPKVPRREKTTRKRKKLTKEKDKENLKKQQEMCEVEDANQPSTSAANNECYSTPSQTLPHKFFQKNWLKISSQKHRDLVKRRKLNYFSQPQFTQAYENDIEFSNCDLHISNSQPVSSVSGSSLLFNKSTESPQLSDDGVDFCQKMFSVSFKDNAQKYLKKNSKSYKSYLP